MLSTSLAPGPSSFVFWSGTPRTCRIWSRYITWLSLTVTSMSLEPGNNDTSFLRRGDEAEAARRAPFAAVDSLLHNLWHLLFARQDAAEEAESLGQ